MRGHVSVGSGKPILASVAVIVRLVKRMSLKGASPTRKRSECHCIANTNRRLSPRFMDYYNSIGNGFTAPAVASAMSGIIGVNNVVARNISVCSRKKPLHVPTSQRTTHSDGPLHPLRARRGRRTGDPDARRPPRPGCEDETRIVLVLAAALHMPRGPATDGRRRAPS